MKATQVSKENGVVKFNIEFSAEEFKEALNKAYLANKGKFQIDGFRKGKAPRKIIESHYGHDVFWDDALNSLLENGYYDAVKDMDLEVVSQPSFEAPEVKDGEPVVLSGSVQVFPEIEVENYKGLEIEKVETVIGDKEVQEELERVQKSQARMEIVEDRKSENGDTVVIDFDGSVDGEPFSGGKADNYELTLGSGQFIPGFEEQLEGKEAGEEVDVEVVFPGDYHAEELAGKPALFKCKIHEIKKEILPEIDDELASDVSDFETLAEYKEDLKKKLQEKAAETDLSVMKDRVLVYKIIFASSVLFTGFTLLMWLLSEGSGLYKVSIIALLMVINLGYGGGFSTLPALLSSRFGMNNISKIHGITLSAWAVAGLTGNNMSEVILKATSPSVATRCYDLLLFATIILYAIAFIFSFFTNKKKENG